MLPEQISAAQSDTLELQRRLLALGRLVEISLVMNSTLELHSLLNYIMQAATEIIGAEAASILLMDRNTGDLRFAAASNAEAQGLIGMTVPVEGSIAGTIITEDRAIIIEDAAHDPRHFRQVDEQIEFRTRSILGVPMRMREKLIGVLEVLNKCQGQFTDDDVLYITILAAQAAVAIETARLVESLEKAYADLNRLNKLKTDFIAIASHELRTPLGVILGYATFLREDAQGEMSEHAEAVLNSALQMRSLIEGMTNLRYVQIDESEMVMEDVYVNDLLRTACRDVRSLAEAKDQIFEMEELPEALIIRADRGKLVLALTNVLNNAIKFTPAGGVIILSAALHGREVWISVRDNGVGIPRDQLERIFEQFYQVEDPMTRQHGGLGLGLSIARAIVERHGGRIWAESPGINEGSHFTLALPLPGSQVTSTPDSAQR